jgi:hypothetical protein
MDDTVKGSDIPHNTITLNTQGTKTGNTYTGTPSLDINEIRKEYYSFVTKLSSNSMLEEFRQITKEIMDVCYRRLDELALKVNEIHEEQEQLQAFVSAIEEGQ